MSYNRYTELAEQVTAEVIAGLEQGKVLWQKPWHSLGMPRNYRSGRLYSGFNAFYLNYLCDQRGWKAPLFVTFRQALELGGNVRKGEKGTPVTYWKITEDRKTKEKKFFPFVHSVFNVGQTEGIEVVLPEGVERSEHEAIAACLEAVARFPAPAPEIRHGGHAAYYHPGQDYVQMPDMGLFHSPQHYHGTLFHELVHATGHERRLNRFTPEEKATRFGDENYSKEELVAEMGAAFLCAWTGIREEVKENSLAYLQGWLSKLRDDKTLLLTAASKAYKAASYIMALPEEAIHQPLSIELDA
jgi:antirestriction protein ArdC